MGSFNIHAGHCPSGQGAIDAVGILDQSVEKRKVKNKIISALQGSPATLVASASAPTGKTRAFNEGVSRYASRV